MPSENGTVTGVEHDYSKTASRYDLFRRPVGVSALCGSIEKVAIRRERAPSELTVVATCCGTGNHEAEMVRAFEQNGGSPTIHLADLFPEMLEQAATNVGEAGGQFETYEVDVTKDRPPLRGEGDWISMLHCWQHFDRSNRKFPGVQQAIRFAHSSLRSGGTFALVPTTPYQSRRTRWYQLAGKVAKLPRKKDPGRIYAMEYPRLEQVTGFLRHVGFQDITISSIDGPLIHAEWYYDPRRLLEEGEDSVSFFKLAKKRKLWDEYLSAVMPMVESGDIYDVIAQSERYRQQMGVAWLIEAVKA